MQHAVIGPDSQFKERFVKPNLIFQGNETASLIPGDRSRLRVERVEAQIVVIRAIVENARVQDMFRRNVVLQAQEIVSGPWFVGVGVRSKPLYDAKSMLHAHGVEKPKA